MKINLNQINSFKSYMKFFQIAKVSNDLGISSRNKAPDIKDPKDIVSKSATVMSRLLSSNTFTPVIEFTTPLASYTSNVTWSKKRTPTTFVYNAENALISNLKYSVGVGISSNALAKIPTDSLHPLSLNSFKNIIFASSHSNDDTRHTWGGTNNLGYYADTFFKVVERSNAFLVDQEYAPNLIFGINELMLLSTHVRDKLNIDTNRNNADQFPTDQNVVFQLDFNETFLNHYGFNGFFCSISKGGGAVLRIDSLSNNFAFKSQYRSDAKITLSNIVLNVTDLEKAYLAFSDPTSNLDLTNNKFFLAPFNYADYFSNQLFGINNSDNVTAVINFRLKSSTGECKDITYVISSAEYKELNLDIRFKLNFLNPAFNDHVNLSSGLSYLKSCYEGFVNDSLGRLV